MMVDGLCSVHVVFRTVGVGMFCKNNQLLIVVSNGLLMDQEIHSLLLGKLYTSMKGELAMSGKKGGKRLLC